MDFFKKLKNIPQGFLWKLKKVRTYLSRIFYKKIKNFLKYSSLIFMKRKEIQTYF
jgi:hypothetical protein